MPQQYDWYNFQKLLDYAEEHKEDWLTSKEISKAVGFASSAYIDRVVSLSSSNPLRVFERRVFVEDNKETIRFKYVVTSATTAQLKKWIKSLNTRKYVKSKPRLAPKVKTPPEPSQIPTEPNHNRAIDAITDLIAENMALKEKLKKIQELSQIHIA